MNPKKVSICHPEKPHRSNGLCVTCWWRQYRSRPEVHPKYLRRQASWRKRDRKKNPEKWSAKGKRKRENNRETTLASQRKWRFKITHEEYKSISKEQNHVCAICGGIDNGRSLAVDHNHSTGYIRGLLCRRCNQGIGSFGENIELLQKAILYLQHTATHPAIPEPRAIIERAVCP